MIHPLRWLNRVAGRGCYCCGTTRRLMWSAQENPFALRTVCVRCKFGACEKCS